MSSLDLYIHTCLHANIHACTHSETHNKRKNRLELLWGRKVKWLNHFQNRKKNLEETKGKGKKASGSPGSKSAQQRVCWVLCLLFHLCCKTAEEKHFIAIGFFIFIFYVFEWFSSLYVCVPHVYNASRSQMWVSDHLGLDLKTTVSSCGNWKLTQQVILTPELLEKETETQKVSEIS